MLLVAATVGLFYLPDPWRFIALGAAAVFEVGELYFWIRFLRRYRITTGIEGMVGERGEAIERCASDGGRVRVRGEIWRARSEAPIERGDSVRIRAVDGLTLLVEADE